VAGGLMHWAGKSLGNTSIAPRALMLSSRLEPSRGRQDAATEAKGVAVCADDSRPTCRWKQSAHFSGEAKGVVCMPHVRGG